MSSPLLLLRLLAALLISLFCPQSLRMSRESSMPRERKWLEWRDRFERAPSCSSPVKCLAVSTWGCWRRGECQRGRERERDSVGEGGECNLLFSSGNFFDATAATAKESKLFWATQSREIKEDALIKGRTREKCRQTGNQSIINGLLPLSG